VLFLSIEKAALKAADIYLTFLPFFSNISNVELGELAVT
jgi:hypothetical protein